MSEFTRDENLQAFYARDAQARERSRLQQLRERLERATGLSLTELAQVLLPELRALVAAQKK